MARSLSLATRSALIGAWVAAVATGFFFWDQYDATPGDTPTARVMNSVERTDCANAIVVYVHPHCPCSRATVLELEELLREAGTSGWSVRFVFVCPPGVPAGWEQGSLWEIANRFPRATAVCDPTGAEARRLGATTSGHVVCYAADRSVAFVGGITPARGRVGECPGSRAVRSLLVGDVPATRSAPVFGCPLFDPASCCDPTGVAPCPR